MTGELRIWAVGEPGQAEPLAPIQQMPTELALEDLLVRNPEMLEPGLKLVGRQTVTETGWLDLLAVDRDGRLVVYELKRGRLAREAVTQVLDYASDLDAMSIRALTQHIAERSGNDGIQRIDDFEQWYADNFGGVDLSRLLPPRMVLIGLGVDPAVERMARFITLGPADVSVVTFQGFMHGGDRLLARQMEVQPGRRQAEHRRRPATVFERGQDLQEYLVRKGYGDVFDRVCADLRQSLTAERGVREEPRKTGISFMLTEADGPSAPKTYFGVYTEHDGPGIYSVCVLPGAIRWGEQALEKLRDSINLSEWCYGGGFYFSFTSEEEWAERRPAVLEFIKTVMANRSAAGGSGT